MNFSLNSTFLPSFNSKLSFPTSSRPVTISFSPKKVLFTVNYTKKERLIKRFKKQADTFYEHNLRDLPPKEKKEAATAWIHQYMQEKKEKKEPEVINFGDVLGKGKYDLITFMLVEIGVLPEETKTEEEKMLEEKKLEEKKKEEEEKKLEEKKKEEEEKMKKLEEEKKKEDEAKEEEKIKNLKKDAEYEEFYLKEGKEEEERKRMEEEEEKMKKQKDDEEKDLLLAAWVLGALKHML